MAKDMTKGSIAQALITFSIPLILSGLLQQLYSWADAFIVGNVEGEQALAAIGATGTLNNFALSLITGFTVGLAILFAQKYGAKELDFMVFLIGYVPPAQQYCHLLEPHGFGLQRQPQLYVLFDGSFLHPTLLSDIPSDPQL